MDSSFNRRGNAPRAERRKNAGRCPLAVKQGQQIRYGVPRRESDNADVATDKSATASSKSPGKKLAITVFRLL